MIEYEIYLPTTGRDGKSVDSAKVDQVKRELTEAFGGYTHLKQRSEGAWRMGGVTFRDEITILRVLDDGSSEFDMPSFKESLRQRFDQESILIVARDVRAV